MYGDEQIDLYVYKCLSSNIVAFLIALQCSAVVYAYTFDPGRRHKSAIDILKIKHVEPAVVKKLKLEASSIT